jgi:hypothetical protein
MRSESQSRHSTVVAAVVGYEWNIVEQCRGSDPGIRTLNSISSRLSCNSDFSPLGAERPMVRNNHERIQVTVEPSAPRLAPLPLNDPAIQLRHGHEGQDKRVTQQFRIVKLGDGMVLEQERNNVGVNNKAAHAAGSDLLELSCPRQSRSAARKSSICSSSGQKSPCRSHHIGNRALALLGDEFVQGWIGFKVLPRIIRLHESCPRSV